MKGHLRFEFVFESIQDQEIFANTMHALGIHVSISSEEEFQKENIWSSSSCDVATDLNCNGL